MNHSSPHPSRLPSKQARSGRLRSAAPLRNAFAVSVASLILLQGSAQAANYFWTVSGGGTWNSGNDWTLTGGGGAAAGAFPVLADFAIFNTTILNGPETITLDANQAASLTFNNTGSTTIIGSTTGVTPYTLTLGSAVLINPGAGAVTIGGSNMSVVTSGSSTATNNSSNLLTISAPVSVGTTAGSQFAFTGTGDALISGVVGNATGGLAGSLVKAGTGTLTLTAVNTYTGTTSANGGILRIDANAGGSITGTGQTTLGGGTLALLGKAGAATTQTISGLTALTIGSTSTLAVDGGTSTSTALNLGTLSLTAGSGVNITTANGGIVSTTQAVVGGILSSRVILNSNDFAVGNGAGNAITPVATSALNTATATDTLNSSLTGGATLAANKTTNSLTVRTDGTSLAEAGNTLTLTSGGLLFSGTGDYSITGGTLRGATTTELVANQYSTGNVTISSSIAGAAFTKTGPGSLTLSGNNVNTGVVYASSGALTLSGDNTAATGGVNLSGLGATLNVNSPTALGSGTFNVNQNNVTGALPILNNTSGSALALTPASPVALNGSFVFGTSAGTSANNLTFGSGLVSEGVQNITVTLNGASVLAFNGPFTASRTGFFTVNNGVGATAATALNFNGFTLQTTGTAAAISSNLAGSGTINVTGPITNGISTAGAVAYAGTGALTIAGSGNTYTGGLSVSSGTLNLNSASAVGTGALALNGGVIDNTSGAALLVTGQSAVNIGNSFGYSTAAGTALNNLTIAGPVALPANRVFTLNGAGALTFSGTLTNTAAAARIITVNNGAGTTGTSALNLAAYNLTSGAGAFSTTFAGTGNVNITGPVADGAATVTGSGLNYTGSGRLTLSNPTGNGYTGATSITGANGTLVVSNTSNSATGAGAVTLGSGTANSPSTLASGAGNMGIITGPVTTLGKTFSLISPGSATAVGSLTLGGLTAATGTAFTFNLGATSGGSASDLLTITGALAAPTAANSTNLLFNFVNGGVTPGTSYTLLTYNSATGLDLGDLTATGVAGTFSITNPTGPGEIDFMVAAVPEPSVWAAGAFFLGAFVVCRYRVRSKQA